VDPGLWLMFSTGLTQADEGKVAYGVDNQTFNTSSGGGTRPPMGEVWEVIDATTAFVKIDPTLARVLVSLSSDAPGASLTDAAATILVSAGKWRVLPAATLSAARVLTLGTTGAVAGDIITVTRLDVTANTYTIANGGGGGGNVVVFPVSKQSFADCYFDGTNWSAKKLGTI